MNYSENISLKNYNTFGIDVKCKYFAEITGYDQFNEAQHSTLFSENKKLILGGGSNILFTKDFNGFILKNNIQGIEVIEDTEDDVLIKVGAGEVWHEFVLYCIDQGFGGVENLSLIPGNVGASPMQNIGAYGVEVKDLIEKVEYAELNTGNIHTIYAKDCDFEYRSSVFKTKLSGQTFILYVYFRLSKNPTLNTTYGAIEQELNRMNTQPTLKSISQAVIAIRQSKLPDPKVIGNAGSFFKNPIVSNEVAERLKKEFQEIPLYTSTAGTKVAAGWLIEKAGWKGKRIDSYGVHKNQALVLVNYGGASGNDINLLADEIQKSIYAEFGISLEKEVNIY